MKFKVLLAAALLSSAVLVTAASLGAAAPAKQSKVTRASVTAGAPEEMSFTLARTVVRKGTVIFKVVNKGETAHDFKINGKKTPDVQPGGSATLKVTFRKKGSYPYRCTVPGHAEAGMKGVLTVK